MSVDNQKQYNIEVGQTFESIEEAKFHLIQYCHQEKQWFRIRTSGAIKKNNKDSGTQRIVYKCKHGDDVRLRGKGERKTKTSRLGCTASITMHENLKTKKVLIKDCKLDHSTHPLTTAFFHLLKEVRLKMTDEQKQMIKTLLEVDGNRRMIQKKLFQQNKFLKLKDLTNRKALSKNADRNNLKSAVQYLLDDKEADVYLRYDDHSGEVIGLFFCTKEMKINFGKFPQILCMDGTYKLTMIDLTFVLLLCVNGEGSSIIVGAGLLAGEDTENFIWFLTCFVECHPNAKLIKSIMSDKCAKERAALRKLFPGVPLYICRFHSMQIFDRTLLVKIGNKKIRDEVKEILIKLIYSSSEAKYMQEYDKLCSTAPQTVVNYFNDNWHEIRELWCEFGMVNFNLGNLTNNRLESINQKLKQIIKKNSSLMDFLTNFFIWEESHLVQDDFKMQDTYSSRPVDSLYNPFDSPTEMYRLLLTTEAFRSINENFEKCQFLTFQQVDEMEKYGVLISKTSELKVEVLQCECPFWKRMELPCHHIFGLRLRLNMPLYESKLCHERWTRQHSVKDHRLFKNQSASQGAVPKFSMTKSKNKGIMTVPQKKRQIEKITAKISVHMSHLCGEKFEESENKLQRFLNFLKSDVEFEVMEKGTCIHEQNNSNEENIVDTLAVAVATLSFEDSICTQPEDLKNIKIPSPIKFRGRPSQMSITTPVPRKRKTKRTVRYSPE